MHPLIEKLLTKRGIKSVTELHENEKETFDKWERTLSDGEVTVEKIREFCEQQVRNIEARWNDLNSPPEKNERLIVYHVVYRALIGLVSKPNPERENLEKYLRSLIG